MCCRYILRRCKNVSTNFSSPNVNHNGSTASHETLSLRWDDSEYSHSSGLVTWVRNKSCQPDLHFSEQTDVTGGTTTLQLGTDVVDLDSGDFPDVTSSDVEDDVNLRVRVLIVLSQACDSFTWLLRCDLVTGFLPAPIWFPWLRVRTTGSPCQ